MKLNQTIYEILDTGTYTATVSAIDADEGQFGPQLKWLFKLEDGSTQTAWTSQSYSNKSKLFAWTRAILGETPDPLDTDDLIGRPCRLSIVIKTRDDGTEYNKVDNVLAPKAAQKRRPAPEPEAEPEEAVEPIPF